MAMRAIDHASASVTGQVVVSRASGEMIDSRDVVVVLKPVSESGTGGRLAPPVKHLRMRQQNKRFDPHLLVVTVGSSVEFPNLDPFFHNVFSMFDGKRFDLGLYEAGSSRSVTFTTPGVCYIFCNIHPEMSAVIVVIDTPYYAVSNAAGDVSIPGVPPGRYTVSVWHERHKPEPPFDVAHEISVSAGGASLGTVRLSDAGPVIASHKNKYGRDYVPAAPSNPIYK